MPRRESCHLAAHHSVWIGPPNRQFCKQRERHSEQADTTHQDKRANRTMNDADDEREHRERPSQNNRAEALDDVIRTQLSRAPHVTRSCPLADGRVKAIPAAQDARAQPAPGSQLSIRSQTAIARTACASGGGACFTLALRGVLPRSFRLFDLSHGAALTATFVGVVATSGKFCEFTHAHSRERLAFVTRLGAVCGSTVSGIGSCNHLLEPGGS